MRTHFSGDDVRDPADANLAQHEVFNAFDIPASDAPSSSETKRTPVMLLRNLSPAEGLCNGTRLIVRRVINGRLLEATTATGELCGQVVWIQRINVAQVLRDGGEGEDSLRVALVLHT